MISVDKAYLVAFVVKRHAILDEMQGDKGWGNDVEHLSWFVLRNRFRVRGNLCNHGRSLDELQVAPPRHGGARCDDRHAYG